MAQSKDNTSGVKFGLLLWKPPGLFQVLEQFPSLHKLHHKVKLFWRLEGVLKVDQEGVVYMRQHFFLRFGVFQLIKLNDHFFFENLDCIEF